MLKIQIFAPNQPDLIETLMQAATAAGAGKVGNYSGCAFVSQGLGHWLPETGSRPAVGEIGVYSHESEVKIEMTCPEIKAMAVLAAVKAAHPYETPAIEFVQLVEVD